MGARLTITTARAPGAIGIVQLTGTGTVSILESLTGKRPALARYTLADFDGIDEGVVALLREDWAQLMPHGGMHVMRRLTQRLVELGAQPADTVPPRELYPEARDEIEAKMLAALAEAASPAAVNLLLDQPRLWRQRDAESAAPDDHDPRRHWLRPPSVVLVGRANVGKSTLTNLVMGRDASLAADLPGTTRDWVAGLAELPTPVGELAVRWFDTPGLRPTSDPIEQRAIELAQRVVAGADVLVVLRDPQTDWPEIRVRRQPDLWVMNKADTLTNPPAGEGRREAPLAVSALNGLGLDSLGRAVAERLGLLSLRADQPWVFWSGA